MFLTAVWIEAWSAARRGPAPLPGVRGIRKTMPAGSPGSAMVDCVHRLDAGRSWMLWTGAVSRRWMPESVLRDAGGVTACISWRWTCPLKVRRGLHGSPYVDYVAGRVNEVVVHRGPAARRPTVGAPSLQSRRTPCGVAASTSPPTGSLAPIRPVPRPLGHQTPPQHKM